MKNTKFIMFTMVLAASLCLTACSDWFNKEDKTPSLKLPDFNTEKAKFDTFKIEGCDEYDDSVEGVITLNPSTEKREFKISGYFKGQIVNNTKNTKIILNNAFIENDDAPAILGNAKTEISAAADSVNFILVTGNEKTKNGAIATDKKNLELGGSGVVYVSSAIKHGIKGDEVKFKGSGTYYVQGSASGSAINCETFVIEASDKTVTIYAHNSGNGIKADDSISIASGDLNFINVDTALKTDTVDDDQTVEHYITISGGTIKYTSVKTKYITDEGKYTES